MYLLNQGYSYLILHSPSLVIVKCKSRVEHAGLTLYKFFVGDMLSVTLLCHHVMLAQILEINRLEFPSSFYFQSDYVTAQIGYEIKTKYARNPLFGVYFLTEKPLLHTAAQCNQQFSDYRKLHWMVWGQVPCSMAPQQEPHHFENFPLWVTISCLQPANSCCPDFNLIV